MIPGTRRIRSLSNLLVSLFALQATTTVAAPPDVLLQGQEVARTPDGKRPNALIPLPVLFRQPETGTGFGAAVTVLFRLRAGEGDAPSRGASPSTLTALAIYTTRKQAVASLETNLRLQGDRLRLGGATEVLEFPTTFWGIGNRTGDELEENYTTRAVNLELKVLREVRPGWYGGVTARFARRTLSDLEPGGLLERDAVPGSENGRIVGLGLALARDTRDRSVSPRSGAYHQMNLGRFDSVLGSDFEFTGASLDLRRYQPVDTERVLALRVLGVSIEGTAPFDVLPQLGGEELLRGYYGGRFRDKTLLAFQAEIRSPLWWRFGVAAFGAMGQVASSPSDLRGDGMKLALGGGLRFALNNAEGLNLRADFGWGLATGTRGFYLSLGEAF